MNLHDPSYEGERMSRYQEVRKTMGTVYYPESSFRSNMYEDLHTYSESDTISTDLLQLLRDNQKKKRSSKPNTKPKIIQVNDKIKPMDKVIQAIQEDPIDDDILISELIPESKKTNQTTEDKEDKIADSTTKRIKVTVTTQPETKKKGGEFHI